MTRRPAANQLRAMAAQLDTGADLADVVERLDRIRRKRWAPHLTVEMLRWIETRDDDARWVARALRLIADFEDLMGYDR